MRAAWLRNRSEFLALCASRDDNHDLQLLYTFFEFLVPVVLDFLPIVRTGSEAMYERALPYFMKALRILNMNYFEAFLTMMNDFVYLKKRLSWIYTGIMKNKNRCLITLDIEYQHRLLAGLTGNCTVRDWTKFDQFMGELPRLEEGNSHYDYYAEYYNQHVAYAWRYVDEESNPKNDEAINLFAEKLRSRLTTVPKDGSPWWFDFPSSISETRKVQSFGGWKK